MENEELIKACTEKAQQWLTPAYDAETQAEVKRMLENPDKTELIDSFYKDLEFGTGGLRGIMGAGTNRMNIYTVGAATQGLSNYLNKCFEGKKDISVVVGHDCRNNSRKFAEISADIFSANGIKVYLFDDMRPTPEMSFAIRQLGCQSGIILTASHNPKEYNGYKVYGADGAQMSPEDTAETVKYISAITDYFSIKEVEVKEIKKSGSPASLVVIDKRMQKSYYDELVKLTLSKKAVKEVGKKIKIVYTPVHGSGYVPVTTILKRLKIRVSVVEEQVAPDPNFSTVEVPNPEFKETLKMGIALADKIKADVVFGTDPDCDRLGVAIRNDEGEFLALTGNQTGVLLLDYILLRLKAENKLPANGVVVKSFVSTGMAQLVCANYGVELVETPVGFKFIGEKIKQYEADGSHSFIFGFEESCGYLRGTHARDKDAVVASMLFAEMVCYYQSVGKSVYGRLKELYEKYGFVADVTDSIKYSGLNAMAEMNAAVGKLREKTVTSVGIYTVSGVRDYLTCVRTSDGQTQKMSISGVNCLYYELLSGGFICLRPSGTEPKLKIYYSVKAKDKAHADKAIEELRANFTALLKE